MDKGKIDIKLVANNAEKTVADDRAQAVEALFGDRDAKAPDFPVPADVIRAQQVMQQMPAPGEVMTPEEVRQQWSKVASHSYSPDGGVNLISDFALKPVTAADMRIMQVEVGGGEYTVVQEADGNWHALRHGRQWRSLNDDNLVQALTLNLIDAQANVAMLRDKIAQAKTLCASLQTEAENYRLLRDAPADSNVIVRDMSLDGFQNVKGIRLDATCSRLRQQAGNTEAQEHQNADSGETPSQQ